jgi:malate synthase A
MEARTAPSSAARVDVRGPCTPASDAVLTADALAFVADLARRFTPKLHELLARRRERQLAFDRGAHPDFLAETVGIRAAPWTVAPIPAELLDRRVELTGPVDRKTLVNGLNSGANVYMADFEDATSPTWANLLDGQRNLIDAIDGSIRWAHPETGRIYALADHPAVLFVRPRGWHLWEKHVLVDGQPVPAALFDFGLFVWHNGARLARRGRRPCFYLPKLESHREARLWAEAFAHAEDAVGLPAGTIRATALIETLPAAFEMDEILWELRAWSAGLNFGRWDYIFSYVKTFAERPGALLPDRGALTMEMPFLAACARALVSICHRRGVHAMGGMAAQIPLKDDPEATARAMAEVRADKEREARLGHDGTWVAHPALVPVARAVFDAHVRGPNQLPRIPSDRPPRAAELCAVPEGPRTAAALERDVEVCVRYLEAWLRGVGCVPIFGRMEDAATVEIARAQIWQWIRHGARLDDGTEMTVARFEIVLDETVRRLRAAVGEESFARGRWEEARVIFHRACTARRLPPFVTSLAYERIVTLLPPPLE